MQGLMPLPDFTREPLTDPVPLAPLPNQLILIPDFEEITMAPKTAVKPTKTPRKKVTVKPAPTVDVDRDGMLREACGGQQSAPRWDTLRGGATSLAILDLLAEIWGGGWGHSNPDRGWTWSAKGGVKPGIWFGVPHPIGPADLSGEKLAQAVRRLMEIPEPGATAEQDQQSQRDALLVRALLGTEGAESRWRRVFSGAVVSAVDILGQLADEWQGGPGHIGPDGEYVTRGGKRPAIWFSGSTRGEPDLSGQHLADAIKRLKIDGLLLPGSPASGSGIDAARTETDDELLLRALDPGHDRWRLARENTELPDGELYQLLKITWKKPVFRKAIELDDGFCRAFYARAYPYPAVWFDSSAPNDTPTLGTADSAKDLLTEVRRVLDLPGQVIPEPPAAVEALHFAQLPLDQIAVVFNDRETFADDALQELADSIKAVGILQPLTVSLPDALGLHTLIAGERRLRAARLAGLETVPVVMRAFSPEDLAVARLTENLLRVDLTPIEQAKAFRRLLDGGLTQRDLAAKVGWSQALIANRVRLLNLPDAIQRRVISGEINPTDARQLATWADRANVMEWLVEDLENNTGTPFPAKPLELLWGAIEACSQAMTGARGPRFKVTDELRQQLDIVEVHIGNRQEERAFNVALWNEQQQAAQAALRERKAAAAEKKQDAVSKSAEPVKRKPTLTPYSVNRFWQRWVGRQLIVEFSGKLKPKQTELLRRIALITCEDCRGSLQDHWSISYEDATVQLLTRNLDTLLDAIAADFLRDLHQDRTHVLGDRNEALAIAETCGITLDAFQPSEEDLAELPFDVVCLWAAEYAIAIPASETLDDECSQMIDQLAEAWTPGWIPEELDYTGGE